MNVTKTEEVFGGLLEYAQGYCSEKKFSLRAEKIQYCEWNSLKYTSKAAGTSDTFTGGFQWQKSK